MSLALTAEQSAHLVALGEDGTLTPAQVIADARRRGSPLHPLFEWDTAKQVERYLAERARTIIRSVRYLPGPEQAAGSAPINYYLRDPNAGAQDQGYVSIPVLLADRDRALRTLQGQLGHIIGLLDRLRESADVLGLSSHVEPIVDSLVRLRSEVA